MAALVVLAACGGGKKKAPEGADEAQAAWKSAGMKAEGFTAVDGAAFAGGTCTGGMVDGLRTVVCEYKDDASLSRGEQAAYQSLEEAPSTGAVVRSGKSLLVVTDVSKVDPNGKRLNKLANVFRGKSSQ